MGLRAASPVLVGRQAELTRLVEAFGAVVVGGSAVVLVGGEAGVGKSRLVQEFTGVAESRGARVCIGRCLQFGEAGWPLAPLGEIVTALVEELDTDTFDLIVGDARGVLAGLVPGLGVAREGAPTVSTEQLCQLVVGVFGRLAERRALVLVFEDLHWADATTTTLFASLAGARRVHPLLLVGTFRSDELPRRHPLRPMLAEIERGRCERIEVSPLGRAETAELVRAIHESAVNRSYVEAVHRRSAGNPFFVEELVAAQRLGVIGLPDTLRDVILARSAALDDRAIDVLGVVAAAGATVPAVLADVSRLEDDALQTSLGELFATALLVADGDEVRFRHELGREVIHDELAPGQRARVHARLAESLQARRPESLGEIARHWSAANDIPRALTASMAAGQQMMRTGAAAEAEGHFARALEMWGAVDDAATLTGQDHAALLMATAIAAEHAAHLDRAIDLAREAAAELAALDSMREGVAWLLLLDLYYFTARWDDYDDAVTHALATVPESPPSAERAEALAAAAHGEWYANRSPEKQMMYARRSVEVAEAVGDLGVLVVSNDAVVKAQSRTGDKEGALATSLANLQRCASAVSPARALTAYNAVVFSLVELGRNAEIPGYAERGVALARGSGLGGPRGAWMAQYWIESLVALGQWAEAERVVGEVADLLDHPTLPRGRLAATWGVALIRQGRLDEAAPLFDQARAGLLDASWHRGRGNLAAAIVEFDVASGCCADAEAVVNACLGQSLLVETDEYLVTRGIAALADCLHADLSAGPHQARRRAVATATRWIERLESRYQEEPSQPVRWRVLQRDQIAAEFERLQGRSDPERWARLVAGCAENGFRYDEALARYHRAEALLAGAQGRASEARKAAGAELARAREVATELRGGPARGDRRLGPPRPALRGPDHASSARGDRRRGTRPQQPGASPFRMGQPDADRDAGCRARRRGAQQPPDRRAPTDGPRHGEDTPRACLYEARRALAVRAGSPGRASNRTVKVRHRPTPRVVASGRSPSTTPAAH